MKKFVGCSGYLYYHWKGRFYPEELPQNKWFSYYAKIFKTVELNSPFYRWPKISTAKSWYKNSPKDFIYTLKVNRLITHIKKFKDTKNLIKDFYKLGDELREKLGCFLFQLPPSIKFNRNKLNEIIEQLDPERKNVIEFRHVSWFVPEVYDSLKESETIFCIVSSPQLPEDFVKTADDIYIRFHGKLILYGSNYSDSELKEWAEKIKRSNAKNVWAYFNNDFNAYATRNALSLIKFLEK